MRFAKHAFAPFIVALGCAVMLPPARADIGVDLGTIGPVYPIKEEDWLVWVKRRLTAMEKSGEIARRMEEGKRQALASMENPKPLPGIGPTVEAKTWWYDPSIVVTENVVDGQGHIVVAAGTRKNPLEVVALSKRLVFFDARDAKQVAFAKALANEGARVLEEGIAAGVFDEGVADMPFLRYGPIQHRRAARHLIEGERNPLGNSLQSRAHAAARDATTERKQLCHEAMYGLAAFRRQGHQVVRVSRQDSHTFFTE